VRAGGGRRGRRPAPRVPPPAEHRFLVDQPQVHRRPGGDPAPLQYSQVEAPDDLADLVLGVQVPDRLGEPFGLLAQPQRGGQQVVGGHALTPQEILQPGLGPAAAAGDRLARARQVIEGTLVGRLGDPLVDPRGEADLSRFALSHAGFHASGGAGQRRPTNPGGPFGRNPGPAA